MRELWSTSPKAYSAIASIHELANKEFCGSRDARIQQCAALFDRAAAISPEAGVALYSLGNERLLERATRELVALMSRWNLFDAAADVLDLGCGSGRCLEALAPLVHSATGIDISAAMLRMATRRVARFVNVSLVRGTGLDLSVVADRRFRLIIAVDSFPYLVATGVAENHMRDCSELLLPGGKLLILNFSYRESLALDRADIAASSRQYGLAVMCNGTRDLELWDGATFLVERPPR